MPDERNNEYEIPFNQKVKTFGQQSALFFAKGQGFFNSDTLFSDDKKLNWFEPIFTCSEFFSKAVGIFVAPLAYLTICLEFAMLGTFMLFKSVGDLLNGDTVTAKDSATYGLLTTLVIPPVGLILGVISFFANLIDLCGSVSATFRPQDQEEDDQRNRDRPAYN